MKITPLAQKQKDMLEGKIDAFINRGDNEQGYAELVESGDIFLDPPAMTTPDDIGIKPVAFLQTNEQFGKELSFPELSHRLTDADKKYGWSEVPLYSDPDVRAALAAKDAEIARLKAKIHEANRVTYPFASLASEFIHDGDMTSRADDRNIWGFNDHDLTYGDFRAAYRFNVGELE